MAVRHVSFDCYDFLVLCQTLAPSMIEHVINSAVLYRDKRMEGGCAEHLYRVFHLNMICILPSIRWPPKVDFQVLKKVAAHSGGLEN